MIISLFNWNLSHYSTIITRVQYNQHQYNTSRSRRGPVIYLCSRMVFWCQWTKIELNYYTLIYDSTKYFPTITLLLSETRANQSDWVKNVLCSFWKEGSKYVLFEGHRLYLHKQTNVYQYFIEKNENYAKRAKMYVGKSNMSIAIIALYNNKNNTVANAAMLPPASS